MRITAGQLRRIIRETIFLTESEGEACLSMLDTYKAGLEFAKKGLKSPNASQKALLDRFEKAVANFEDACNKEDWDGARSLEKIIKSYKGAVDKIIPSNDVLARNRSGLLRR